MILAFIFSGHGVCLRPNKSIQGLAASYFKHCAQANHKFDISCIPCLIRVYNIEDDVKDATPPATARWQEMRFDKSCQHILATWGPCPDDIARKRGSDTADTSMTCCAVIKVAEQSIRWSRTVKSCLLRICFKSNSTNYASSLKKIATLAPARNLSKARVTRCSWQICLMWRFCSRCVMR